MTSLLESLLGIHGEFYVLFLYHSMGSIMWSFFFNMLIKD